MQVRTLAALVLVALLAAACGAPSGDIDTWSEIDAGADATDGDAPAADVPVVVPVITGFQVKLSPDAPLAATATLTTDPEASVAIQVADLADGSKFSVAETGKPATGHAVPVLGLRFGRQYAVTATATTASGGEAAASPLQVETSAAPADLPQVEVVASQPDRMAPGWTLMNVGRLGLGSGFGGGFLMALDPAGRIVWYTNAYHLPGTVKPLASGNLMYVRELVSLVEVDWAGKIVKEWKASDLGLDSIHHNFFEMPSGNLLVLSSELRAIDGYPAGGRGTKTYNVVGDVVVEMTREGDIVGQWKLLDLLDPHYTSEYFDLPFWNFTYPDAEGGTKDWSHANEVLYLEEDDSLLVTLAYLHWVVKIDCASGKLRWRFGPQGDFKLAAGGTWPDRPHGTSLLPDGSLLLIDEGTIQTTHWTRAAAFALTFGPGGEPGQAKESWSFGSQDKLM